MMPAESLSAPIEVPYKLAAPPSWARAMLKPLGMALRRIVPDQARSQRELSALDREFKVTAATESGWRVELRFNGPDLTVGLHPPENVSGPIPDDNRSPAADLTETAA